ncbi:hypothetical protein CIHG_07308 [Coccidioides immitis H538.4]|uniref:Uncharacterized protein n=2 Tax=Coccidioides immitis TaxID=5501 RepID=A0A0J8RY45_COCIT|nr:hypothetical protein CIRG_00642 [Coccidioides immitis RMSCC 2394]KMU89501.1 hypothetical protein CIHG_07308 [Coccidioides immitis H538.4]
MSSVFRSFGGPFPTPQGLRWGLHLTIATMEVFQKSAPTEFLLPSNCCTLAGRKGGKSPTAAGQGEERGKHRFPKGFPTARTGRAADAKPRSDCSAKPPQTAYPRKNANPPLDGQLPCAR